MGIQSKVPWFYVVDRPRNQWSVTGFNLLYIQARAVDIYREVSQHCQPLVLSNCLIANFILTKSDSIPYFVKVTFFVGHAVFQNILTRLDFLGRINSPCFTLKRIRLLKAGRKNFVFQPKSSPIARILEIYGCRLTRIQLLFSKLYILVHFLILSTKACNQTTGIDYNNGFMTIFD